MQINWLSLSQWEQIQLLNHCEQQTKMSAYSIEKDWWVTQVLKALSASLYASHIVFKGGTSLSKGWNLIQRFSEDVDISINREFLGFGGELSKNQISDRLRRASCMFVRGDLRNEIENQLRQIGISNDYCTVSVNETDVSTTDPETIEVAYLSVLPQLNYLRDKVLIEVGARSLMEPAELIKYSSIIAEIVPKSFPLESVFTLQTVLPTRTFLEKLFLIHEEFSKPIAEIRIDRMSRHLYDIEKLMDTDFAKNALSNESSYKEVVSHRQKFIGLKGFDYNTLLPKRLNFRVPEAIKSKYGIDYRRMQDSMIYGDALSFKQLLERLEELNKRVNEIQFK
ncbi:MAG: nucleotidyl transferase AbiEii/AbiGii toxin family protein [Salinivirgaceae bacterium]